MSEDENKVNWRTDEHDPEYRNVQNKDLTIGIFKENKENPVERPAGLKSLIKSAFDLPWKFFVPL